MYVRYINANDVIKIINNNINDINDVVDINVNIGDNNEMNFKYIPG